MSLHDATAEQLTVIVPTLNEAANIQPLLPRVFEQSSTALQIEVLILSTTVRPTEPANAFFFSVRLNRSVCCGADTLSEA
jgi:hypothetical protein